MTEQEAKIRALVNTVARGEDIAKLDPSIGYMLSLFEVIDAQRLWIANAKRSMGQITSVLWDHGVIASNSEPVRAMLNLLSTMPAAQSAEPNECSELEAAEKALEHALAASQVHSLTRKQNEVLERGIESALAILRKEQ